MYHIFFIHSSVDGHLGCFQVVAPSGFLFFYKFVYLFIYFWLCWVFAAVHGLSLVAASDGYSSLP